MMNGRQQYTNRLYIWRYLFIAASLKTSLFTFWILFDRPLTILLGREIETYLINHLPGLIP